MSNLRNSFFLKYESIYTNKEAKEEFYKHLKKELNTDPFDFILRISEIEKIQEEAKEIYENFIKVGSKREINIGNESRLEFEKIYNSTEENKFIKIDLIFKELVSVMKKELECDSFPRFLRTEGCFDLLKKFQKNEEIVGSLKKKSFPYSEEDFKNGFITEKDILFLNEINSENYDWELIYSEKKKINSYFSPNCEKYLPNLSISKSSGLLKNSLIFPLSLEKTIYYLFHFQSQKNGLYHFESGEHIEIENMEKEYNKLDDKLKKQINFDKSIIRGLTSYALYYNIFPLQPKVKINFSVSAIYEEETDTVVIYQKSSTINFDELKKVQKTKKNNKEFKYTQTIGLSVARYQRISPEKTIFTNTTVLTFSKYQKLNRFVFKKSNNAYVNERYKSLKTFKFPENLRLDNLYDLQFKESGFKNNVYMIVQDLFKYYKNFNFKFNSLDLIKEVEEDTIDLNDEKKNEESDLIDQNNNNSDIL
jgi:hypothetical protein